MYKWGKNKSTVEKEQSTVQVTLVVKVITSSSKISTRSFSISVSSTKGQLDQVSYPQPYNEVVQLKAYTIFHRYDRNKNQKLNFYSSLRKGRHCFQAQLCQVHKTPIRSTRCIPKKQKFHFNHVTGIEYPQELILTQHTNKNCPEVINGSLKGMLRFLHSIINTFLWFIRYD